MGTPATSTAIAVAMIFAGCLLPGPNSGPPREGTSPPFFYETGVEETNRSAEQVWVVWVRGDERVEAKQPEMDSPDRAATCGYHWMYTIDPRNQTLHYDAAQSGFDRTRHDILVVADFQGAQFGQRSFTQGCRTLGRVSGHANTAVLDVSVEHFGPVRVQVFPQGAVGVLQEYVLPLGVGLEVEYVRTASTANQEYWVYGEWHVENMGAWPRDRLRAFDV